MTRWSSARPSIASRSSAPSATIGSSKSITSIVRRTSNGCAANARRVLMTEPVHLITRPNFQNQETVDIPEDYLRMAKAGEITAIAVVGLTPAGEGIHQASSTDRQLMLIGCA